MLGMVLATSSPIDWPVAVLFFVAGLSMLFQRFWRSNVFMSKLYQHAVSMPIVGRTYRWMVPYDQYRTIFTAIRIIIAAMFICIATAIIVAIIVR